MNVQFEESDNEVCTALAVSADNDVCSTSLLLSISCGDSYHSSLVISSLFLLSHNELFASTVSLSHK